MAKQHDKKDLEIDRLDWDSGCMDFYEMISYSILDFDKWANHIYQKCKENWEICLKTNIERGILDECKEIDKLLKQSNMPNLQAKASKLCSLIYQFADTNGNDSSIIQHYKIQLKNRIDEVLNGDNADISLVLFALKRFIEQISSTINISHCNNQLKDNGTFKSLLAFRNIRESLQKSV